MLGCQNFEFRTVYVCTCLHRVHVLVNVGAYVVACIMVYAHQHYANLKPFSVNTLRLICSFNLCVHAALLRDQRNGPSKNSLDIDQLTLVTHMNLA